MRGNLLLIIYKFNTGFYIVFTINFDLPCCRGGYCLACAISHNINSDCRTTPRGSCQKQRQADTGRKYKWQEWWSLQY